MATRFSQAGLQVMLGSDGEVRFTQAGLQVMLDTGDYPVVTITTPASSPTQVIETNPILLEATASDTEDGDLTGSVQWHSSIDGALGSGASVNPTLTIGTHDILAVVTDSDGHSAYAWTVVNVVSDPPTVDITNPDPGHTVKEGESINFVGVATDPQEGDISSGIEWESDIDGAIGTGQSIDPVLSDGDHTVTARATDQAGGFGEDTVDVTVTPNDPPTDPVVNRPVPDEFVTDQLVIAYDESTDPQGDPVTYTFRYRKQGTSPWTVAFQDRSGNDTFLEDLEGLPFGDYEWEMWASDGILQSGVVTGDFFLHVGQPSAPELTNPVQGTEVTADPITVTWEEAVDLEGDPLTYSASYLPPGGAWTSLFSGESGTSFAWDLTGEPTGTWRLRLWANDGTADGPTDEVAFAIVAHNQPSAPAIKIAEVGTSFVTPEAREYGHPFGVAWKATQYQIRPQLGDWSNPTLDVTTTDATEQLTKVLGGLASAFAGEVRMRFQDINDQWGDWSPVADFETLGPLGDWEQQLSPARWQPFGSRIIGRFLDGVADALVVKDAPKLGSARLVYEVMLDGCFCGLSGRDQELRHLGGGLFDGFLALQQFDSVRIYLDVGISTSHPDFAHVVGVNLNVVVPIDSNEAHVRIADLGIMAGRDGGGEFSTHLDVEPWYRFTTEIQRNLSTETTRIRVRVEGPLIHSVPDGEWHLDVVLPTVTPCGRPGYFMDQEAFQLGSAVTWFRRLEYTALRDEGLSDVTTLPPLAEVPDEEDPECVPVIEPSPSEPVLWPAGPTTDDPLEEERAYLTDLLDGGWDDSEQRVQLREVPIVTLSWTARLVESEVGVVQSLLYGGHRRRWGVPLWTDGVPLLEPVGAGSVSIPATAIDLADRRFAPAGTEGRIALIRSVSENEMLAATVEIDGSISLSDPTTQLWPKGTKVYPVRIGRISDTIRLPRPGTTVADVRCQFRLEAVQ